MKTLKSKPVLFSLIIILLILIFHRVPLYKLFSILGLNEYNSNSYDKVVINSISVIGILLIIKKNHIPFRLFSFSLKNLKYYLPLLFYILIFSGGFNDFQNFNFTSINLDTLLSYTLKYASSSFLEEFIFRGLILGVFLLNYPKTKRGILKSVMLSGLIFGLMHIINLWSFDNQTIKGVLNQVYATACFGIMYGATYIKTRSLLTLGLLHFFSNFFSQISELNFIEVISNSTTIADKSLVNIIISEIFRLIVYGIPLIIGLFLIYNTNEKDLNMLTRSAKSPDLAE